MNIKNKFDFEVKKLLYLYDNMPSALAAAFAISIVIYVTFDGIIAEKALGIWLAANIFVVFIRSILFISYKQTDFTHKNISNYYIMYYIGLVLSASTWASSAIFIFPQESEYQIVLILMSGGLLSGAAVSMASKIEMFYTYLFIIIGPFIYVFATKGTVPSNAIFVSLLFYILLLSLIARKISINVNSNILLAFKNKELVETLEVKIDEANNANKAKSKFLSVVSHEIRTPLNAIVGFIKILKQVEEDEKKLTYIETIDKSSYLLLNVINDVLDLSKIESGKFSLEKTNFNPREELCQIYELFEQVCREKEVVFINSISINLPKNINSDKLRLKQIISNLLSNAVKFTPKGKSIEFLVTFNYENSSLYIEVKDKGIGIKNENLSKILEEFTQADNSTSREYGGTGLGLPIVSRLLELFDSKLQIKSEINVGSSFSFECFVDVLEDIAEEEIAVEDEEIDFNAKKVLVAEDNKTNQMLIDILLDEMNLVVTIANDGLEAEEMFKNAEFDIVLMDINMPNKNGIEAMLSIKEYEKTLSKKTPVVALTANAVSGDREKYLKDGFDEYLAKPIDNYELIKVLKTYL